MKPSAALSLPALAATVSLLAAGCGGAPEAGRADNGIERGPHSLLLLTLDTTRADHLEPYGAEDAETPALAALARDGVVFEHAYAVSPVTLPTHATLLTGLYPPQHGARHNGIHTLAEGVPTLAEAVAAAGWRTAAFVSAAVLERRYGLDRGFEVYDDDLSGGGPKELRSTLDRPAAVTVDAARAWLDRLPEGERFFLWVHLFDPHAPYSPPEPFASRFRERPYDGEIAYMDREIGRLLAHLRLATGEAAVAAVGDHGESLGEHGETTHGLLIYDATLRVPWILRLTGGPAGLRVAEPVSQVDLAPTLLDLLALPPLPGPAGGAPSGVSLLPRLEGAAPEKGPSPRSLYAETEVPFHSYGWSKLRSLRRGELKYIEAPAEEVYDLARDPDERRNLSAERPEEARRLAGELAVFGAGEVAAPPTPAIPRDREVAARLRALGYLSGGSGRPEGTPRPDPKEVIDLHEALQRVGVQLQTGRFEEAVRELRAVLARDPENLTALQDLARALAELGRPDDAALALRRALELDPSSATLHLAAADLEARRGDPAAALELAESALDLKPHSQEARLEVARFLALLGRRDEAAALLERELAASANNPWVEVRHAELVELPRGELAAAEARLRRAVERDPYLADAWRLLGRVLERAGRPAEAAETYRAGLQRQPRDAELAARLATLLAVGGDPAAEEALRRALDLDPGYAPAHANLAALAVARRAWGEAEEHARRAVELDPGLASAWNNLGIAREEQGRPAEAEQAYRRAIEADPGFWQASHNLGLLLAKAGRWRPAAEAFAAVLARAPAHPGANYELGRLLAGPLGDPERARRHLEAALAAEPGHPRAQSIRRLLEGLPGG